MRRIRTAVLLTAVASPGLLAQVGDVRRVHDPAIVEEAGAFYVLSTGVGRGDMIPVRRSTDLVHWELVGQVFERLPPWAEELAPRDRNLWAPDIARVGEEYWLYYSVSSFGTNRSAIGLATNRRLEPGHPENVWVDRGKVLESHPGTDDWNAIDPNLVLDREGKPWLSFGSYWSGIKLRRLDLATGHLSPEDSRLHSLARRIGDTAIEAPFLIRSRDHYYLFVSFDHCCRGARSDYRILVGRAEQVTGPYLDREGLPLLEGHGTRVLEGHDNIRGPGHCAVLTARGRDWLVHHFYDAAERGVAKLQIRPIVWTEDGWPVPGDPLPPPLVGDAAASPRAAGAATLPTLPGGPGHR